MVADNADRDVNRPGWVTTVDGQHIRVSGEKPGWATSVSAMPWRLIGAVAVVDVLLILGVWSCAGATELPQRQVRVPQPPAVELPETPRRVVPMPDDRAGRVTDRYGRTEGVIREAPGGGIELRDRFDGRLPPREAR